MSINLIGDSYNNTRLKKVENNEFFTEELSVVISSERNINYYKNIIKNVSLNLDNTQNSYIMWIFEKVEKIDTNKQTTIVKAESSLPDIDMDIERSSRQIALDYCRTKYGHNSVSQMVTYNRLKGRGALKDVLRINSACSFDEINRITSNIPDESKIIDKLEEMEEPSIIRWCLENNPKAFEDYVVIDENNKFTGKYGKYFEQAIRLEGTIKNKSRHAAGIIISSDDLNGICPMVYDSESKEMVAGMEMEDLEYCGHVKMDLLGIASLDKLHMIVNQLETGEMGYDDC